MELVPLISALAGAVIGALASILTTVLTARSQARREMKKLALEIAKEEFRYRVQDQSGRLDQLPASVLIFYYDKLVDLARRGRLNQESIRQVLRDEVEFYQVIEEEGRRLRSTPETGR
jgi:hypothetical protein